MSALPEAPGPPVERDITVILAAAAAETDELARAKTVREHAYALGRHGADPMVVAEHRDALAATTPKLLTKGAFDTAHKAGIAAARQAAKDAAARRPRLVRDQPDIDVTGAPAAIRNLTAALDAGAFTDLYVTGGQIVHIAPISGDISTTADDPLPLVSAPLTAPAFAHLLAHEAYAYRRVTDPSGDVVEEEHVPADRVLTSVLSKRHWPGIRTLRGIVGSPVLRPDGSLLQTPGYDPDTGLYFAPKVPLPTVPDRPAPEQVTAAKRFLETVLHDFPWVAPADKANYLAILISPILRPYLRALTPFWVATATTASSGKSLLVDMVGSIYGKQQNPWPGGEEELRKAILAALRRPEPLICWDNIAEGTEIASATLAGLITGTEWSDRVLGSSKSEKHANDRLWAVTGNNLRLGGDMASRTVVVRLDPNMPNPEARPDSSFQIPNLQTWLTVAKNRQTVQWNLLVLVADWVSAGAPRTAHLMRQFSPWAQAAGGFVTHHGLPGFLDNAADVREMDDQAAMWHAFLARWERKYGTQTVTSAALRSSFEYNPDGSDPWDGAIPDALLNGRHLPTATQLGKRLGGHVGRWYRTHTLRADTDGHTGARLWYVETRDATR
ncbi:hypothetical protein [Candidatus Frankia nodulisporulans]|uniref:hypothetical protein n=1 Tax=Candidatus Frankia nodulisporulans TaxID=2060052 RepID=UPI00158350AE|nr:hypothetical protein [Candidatus Frankia nodulisporulans]